jgi:hypothetical protein
VAIDGAGRAVVAWLGRDRRVLARRITSRGHLGPPRRLSKPRAGAVAGALDRDGTAVIAWARNGEVRVAVSPLRGHFQRTQLIASPGVRVAAVDVERLSGFTVVVWWQDAGTAGSVRYAVAGEDGDFGPPRRLARASAFPSTSAVVTRDGTFSAAWNTGEQAAYAALDLRTRRFGAPAIASPGQPGPVADVGLFAGPGGAALGFAVQGPAPWLMRVAERPDAARTVGTVDPHDGLAVFAGPVVALPRAGGTVAAWSQGLAGSGEVLAAERGADGSYSPAQRLSAAGDLADEPAAAATPGTAIIGWHEAGGLRYALRPADGSFTAPRMLAQAGGRLVLGAAGSHAVAVWRHAGRVLAARLTAP